MRTRLVRPISSKTLGYGFHENKVRLSSLSGKPAEGVPTEIHDIIVANLDVLAFEVLRYQHNGVPPDPESVLGTLREMYNTIPGVSFALHDMCVLVQDYCLTAISNCPSAQARSNMLHPAPIPEEAQS